VSQQINLFTPVFLKQKKLFSAGAMIQALVVFVVGIAVLWMFAYRQVEQLRASAKILASQSGKEQAQLMQMVERVKPAEKDAGLAAEIRTVDVKLKANQQLLAFVSNDSTGKTSHAEYFRALARRTVQGVWLTAFSIESRDNGIEIQGRALQPKLVPAYLSVLREEPLFKGKPFGSIAMRAAEVSKERDAAAPGKPDSGAEQKAVSHIDFVLKSGDAADDSATQEGAAQR
jgi:Tfp pilus assembly protein PilN